MMKPVATEIDLYQVFAQISFWRNGLSHLLLETLIHNQNLKA